MSRDPNIALLRAVYGAFNTRDIDAALLLMTDDVAWPRPFKGDFVHGPDAMRADWTEQYSEIAPHVESAAFYPGGPGEVLVMCVRIGARYDEAFCSPAIST